jgi:hypothetical protein
MQGDIVKAARWLGGCMIAASLILVVGFHPTVTSRIVTIRTVQPEPIPAPSASAFSPPPITVVGQASAPN